MKTISVEDAVAMVPNGASLMIDELVRQDKRNLVVIANDMAAPGTGIGKLVGTGFVGKAVASHIGLDPETQQ
jgi:acetate CoA/acetoacetate CoA-transferase alpha subunit